VREGENILVQVIKDPISDKGARLSCNVTLPGRHLVLVPMQTEITLSRRITDEADRERLTATMTQIMESGGRERMGVILRTAALKAPVEELAADVDALADLWRAIQVRGRMANKPGVLHRDLDAVQRCLRDVVDENTYRVLIDCPLALGAARAYVERVMPHAAAKITPYRRPQPLFDLYGVEQQIETLLQPRAGLPSGGWITIETTEALTAVDVNSGSYTSGEGLEATSVYTNLEAAAEIGRQLRLRGIGGVIVVDFIHMADPANVQKVLDTLSASLAEDRVPTQMSGMSEFGLVEITRKRLRDPLAKLLTEHCGACRGASRVRTVATVANEALRRVAREARANPGRRLIAYAAPDVVAWVDGLGEETKRVVRLRLGAEVRWVARPEFARETYDVGLETAA
jgi:ribonuclease G